MNLFLACWACRPGTGYRPLPVAVCERLSKVCRLGRLWVAGICVLLVCSVAAGADKSNLLANPGFEMLTADQPDRWDNYVQPKPGAVARLDDNAHAGDYSVWLHTPTPYPQEPVNNWSQNIIANFGGETLRVSGFIRVVEAEEAALWVQCWRKKPWGVLSAMSTSTDMPVYGTADWQEVSMEIAVPKGTDFITLRCVLLGTGSAWFDDISVSRVLKKIPDVTEKKNAPAKEEKAEAERKPESISLSESETRGESDGEPLIPVSDAKHQEARIMPLVSRLESEVRRLREANLLLTDTLLQIQEVNEGLAREMLAVQAELRKRGDEEKHAAAPSLEEAAPRVPPLIPLSESREGATP